MYTRNKESAVDVEIPEDLICPLTQQVYLDPVRLPNGTVVEREMVQRWVIKNHTNPFTRSPLGIFEFTPASDIKERAMEFLTQHPEKGEEQFIDGSVKLKTQRRLCFDD